MKITGVKSICCGKGVRTRKNDEWKKDDLLFICLKCKEPCDHYFTAEATRADKEAWEDAKRHSESQ